MNMNPRCLSAKYFVRKLQESDIDAIYDLSRGNALFYRYHPPFVTRESIRDDMRALPPGKDCDDKFYIGFFENDKLAAVMDMICGYPSEGVFFIGLFMLDASRQGQGVGTGIIADCLAYWKELGYQKVRLGVDKGNPQSNAFWSKNGFHPIEEKTSAPYVFVLMERDL